MLQTDVKNQLVSSHKYRGYEIYAGRVKTYLIKGRENSIRYTLYGKGLLMAEKRINSVKKAIHYSSCIRFIMKRHT